MLTISVLDEIYIIKYILISNNKYAFIIPIIIISTTII